MLRLFRKLFGWCGWHFHWQNLNEKPTPKGEEQRYGWILKEGRCWLSKYDKPEMNQYWEIMFAWNVGASFCGIDFKLGAGDCDEAMSLSIQIPWVCSIWLEYHSRFSKWLSLKLLPTRTYEGRNGKQILHVDTYGTREISFTIHDYTFWWNIWENDMEWKSAWPWYRNGSFCPVNFVFGRKKYAEIILQKGKLKIPMPEATYIADYKLLIWTQKRPRWSWWPMSRNGFSGNVEIKNGIPIPGKGENSWDCGPNAIMSMSCPARNKQDLIGAVVKSVMRDRYKYHGSEVYNERDDYVATDENHAEAIEAKKD